MGTISAAIAHNFLGGAPHWYKLSIAVLLIINPMVLHAYGGFAAGWVLLAGFIYTLVAALWCYPFAPGGLLVLQAVALGMAGPHTASVILKEVTDNMPVILLLIFMVPAVSFNKDILIWLFSGVFVSVRSKTALSLFFCGAGAVLSAFLDALTVIAVVMTISMGFYAIYHRFASGKHHSAAHDHTRDDDLLHDHHHDLARFRMFLGNIVMHAGVGTAIGGVMTLVGEPQNIIVGSKMGWTFGEFFLRMAPVTIPTLAAGMTTCYAVEKFRICGYGHTLPERIRDVMHAARHAEAEGRMPREYARLAIQGIAFSLLIAGLATHIAEVGFVGLGVLIVTCGLTGRVDEHGLGESFKESMPFTGVLVVFFVLVAIIHAQHLFQPLIAWVLELGGRRQLLAMFAANALLSAVSDNVFVALTYITQIKSQFDAGLISPEQYARLAVAINTGTNLPSVATPNGQAAFLFLLTSPLAGLIRLSYGRMCLLALPYTIVLTGVAFFAVWFLL